MDTSLIAEIFPLLSSERNINPDAPFIKYKTAIDILRDTPVTLIVANVSTSNLDEDGLLTASQRLFDSEQSRHSSIDGRAAGLMAAIGLAATLVTGIGFTTLNDTATLPKSAYIVAAVAYFVVLLYLAATVIAAFYVQGYLPRSTPDPADLNPFSKKALACKTLEYTMENYKVNNRAVFALYSGMKCFRNAVIILVLAGLAIGTILIISATRHIDSSGLAQALARIAGCTDTPKVKANSQGKWKGTCLYKGQTTSLIISKEGVVAFSL